MRRGPPGAGRHRPRDQSMATLDADHHDIEFHIAVIGGASQFFIESLPLEDGKMQLGELQGWKPRLSFTAFSTDPWADDGAEGEGLQEVLPQIDALVLTDALAQGQHYSSTAVERLARTLSPRLSGMPAAIFGCHALDEEWTTVAGVAPVLVADPTAENALRVVKAVCAGILRSKIRSIPPPPAE